MGRARALPVDTICVALVPASAKLWEANWNRSSNSFWATSREVQAGGFLFEIVEV